jgi:hypothetical protein
MILYIIFLDSDNLYYFLKLVCLAFPLEKDVSRYHIVKNAPQSPYIDLFPIFSGAQEQLWSSVEEGTHHIGHRFFLEI